MPPNTEMIQALPGPPAPVHNTNSKPSLGDSMATLLSMSTMATNAEMHMSSIDNIDQLELLAALGEGPLRFGPLCREKTVRESLMKRSGDEVEKFCKVKMACENNKKIRDKYTDEQIFRVLAFKDFSVRKSIRLLKRMDVRYMNTTIRKLEDQLRTHTLFPLPELHSETIDDFFYMRPSRHIPSITPTSTIIANLVYVMDR
jgi:hypothetical protein